MLGVEEAIAIASIIIEGTRVVGDVVRLVIVKHFKRECSKVRDDCILVLELMRKDESKKVDPRTPDRITRCFEDARTFLRQCAEDWGWFRASVEVMFRRKHQDLQKELKWVTSIFTVDALVSLDKFHTLRKYKTDNCVPGSTAGWTGAEVSFGLRAPSIPRC
jgi:hypothetical protein